MTSLKTSIKTITYLSDTGCLEIQGASLLITLSQRNTCYMRVIRDGQINFLIQSDSRTNVLNVYNMSISGIIVGAVICVVFVVVVDR